MASRHQSTSLCKRGTTPGGAQKSPTTNSGVWPSRTSQSGAASSWQRTSTGSTKPFEKKISLSNHNL
eukprot:5739218-Karenia_brevis.AAC.1